MASQYVLKGMISDFKDSIKDNNFDKANKLNDEIKLVLIDAKKEFLTIELIKLIKNNDTEGIDNFRKNGIYTCDWKTCLDYAKIYDEIKDIANSNSCYQLGIMYQFGYYLTKDINKALDYYTRCANCGNLNGNYSIGVIYYQYHNLNKESEAFSNWELAAKRGHAGACNELGYIYQYGKCDVEININKAFEYYQKSAIKGDPKGLHNLALMYRDGNGIDLDKYKALEYFKMSADQGNPSSKASIRGLLKDSKFTLELAQNYISLKKEGNCDKN